MLCGWGLPGKTHVPAFQGEAAFQVKRSGERGLGRSSSPEASVARMTDRSGWLLFVFGSSLEMSDFQSFRPHSVKIAEAVSIFTVLRGWSAFGPNYVAVDRRQ